MGFGRKGVATAPGKRFYGRLRVRLPARLVTFSKTYAGILLDVSAGGAKLQVEGAPPHGEILLRWDRYEAHGSVCWQKDGRCGIAFDAKVPQQVLLATGELNETSALPGELDLTGAAALAWAEGSAKFGFD